MLLCSNFVSWAEGKSLKLCVAYLTKKQEFSLDHDCSDRAQNLLTRASPQQCTHSVPDFIQIVSLTVEL